MRGLLSRGVVSALVFCQSPARTASPEYPGPIAVSRGVEINEIEITHRKVSYAQEKADLTYMTVGLWFTSDWKGKEESYWVKLLDLAPVVDDTGKVLALKPLGDIPSLPGEVLSNQIMTRDKTGPIITMVLEEPNRRATRLKHLKGKAEVSQVRSQTLKFDLVAAQGKVLDHSLLKGFPIRPAWKEKDGYTFATLGVPPMHARLVSWGLEAQGQMLEDLSIGERGRITLDHTYQGSLPKGCLLVLQVAVPTETKTFEFDFTDIELP